MIILGVTGPSGAGKGAASEYMETKHGFQVIDADKVYHSIISAPSDCVNELVLSFGEKILNGNGGIDRKSLSSLVFGEENKDKLLLLNQITHKYVIAKINELLTAHLGGGTEVCMIDAPLLIEAGIHKICDYVIAVVANKNLRAERIAARDGIDKETALLRINSQKPDSFYEKHSDFVLQNNLDLKTLGNFIDTYLRDIGVIK